MATANPKRTAIRALGEIALRVNDLDAMQRFYEQVIGLPLMNRFPNSAFFKIAEGVGTLKCSPCSTAPRADIAFEIPLADFADELKRLEGLGLQVETAEHAWVHWRSLYVSDPEGNQVELVCYDETV